MTEQTGDPQARFAAARETLARARAELDEARRVLAALAGEINHAASRAKINRHLWECHRALGRAGPYFSEAGQDAFLDRRIFKGKRGGTFVEIGGYDGVTGSNCLFFEVFRGWTGLLIEPAPGVFAEAAAFRRATCLQLAVAGEHGEAEFLEVTGGFRQMSGLTATYDAGTLAEIEADPRHDGRLIRVETRPLADILDAHGLAEVDFVSLDVEGGEMAVLSAFPFERFRVGAWTVENREGSSEVAELMRARGYARVEAMGADEIYVPADPPA